MDAQSHTSPGFLLPFTLWYNQRPHNLRPGTPKRAPRGHPRNPLTSDLTCPVTISPQERVGFQSPCSSTLREPTPRFWDRAGTRGSAGSQHVFCWPAPQTALWFSVPPSISKADPSGEVGVKEVKTKVDSTLTLECECWAMPPPTISWYKDGQVSPGPPGGLRLSVWSASSAWKLPEKAVKASVPRAGLGPAPPFVF